MSIVWKKRVPNCHRRWVIKWFKHYANADTSLKLQKVLDEMGVEGYAHYWLLLELLCEKYDGTSTKIDLHFNEISGKVRIKFGKKLEKVLQKFADFSLIFLEIQGKVYKIDAPILSDLKDRDFKKSRIEREQSAPKNKNKNKKENKNKNITTAEKSPSLVGRFSSIYKAEYFKRHGIQPAIAAKENAQIKKIIETVGIDEALFLAKEYVYYNDPWHVKQKHPIGLLLTQLNKIRVEIENPNAMLESEKINRQLREASKMQEFLDYEIKN